MRIKYEKKRLRMERIRKTVTVPKDLIEWAEKEIKSGNYPGIRSLSGLVEYLLRIEKDHSEKKR